MNNVLNLDDAKLALEALEHYQVLLAVSGGKIAPNLPEMVEKIRRKILENGRVLVTITGGSCSGKTTLAKQMKTSGKYYELVSTTTRKPRAGEVYGVDYYFTTSGEFDRKIFAEKVTFGYNKYGLEFEEINRGFVSGKIPFVIVEPNGLDQIIAFAEKEDFIVFSVFVSASIETRWKRYISRAMEQGTVQSYLANDVKRIQMMFSEEEDWKNRFPSYDLSLDLDEDDKVNEALVSLDDAVIPVYYFGENKE